MYVTALFFAFWAIFGTTSGQYDTPEKLYEFKTQYRPPNLPQGFVKWSPKKAPLMTRWAAEVNPDNAHPEHPRPQFMRNEWLTLNGLWQYAIRIKSNVVPSNFDGEILVPYPVESALSGVMTALNPNEFLWYKRTFTVPDSWKHQKIILHFEAIDWEANVTLNGVPLGSHRGGYQPFSFDITNLLSGSGSEELIVSVWDPTDTSFQPRGKQVLKPGGDWYTATSGIWQTVWLESVPSTYIKSLVTVPDVDQSSVSITVNAENPNQNASVSVTVFDADDNTKVIATAKGMAEVPVIIKIAYAKLWSPDSPSLYPVFVQYGTDTVVSYFGLRKFTLGPDSNGIIRPLLNGQFVFHLGPLDQGWWPDGIYTAPTETATINDIMLMKQFGYNFVRKHVKVEPDRWYYHCDRLGLIVFQDMPSGDRFIGPNDPDFVRTPESSENFFREWREIIEDKRNHPSIVTWITFNEGWGQFNTSVVVDFTKQIDPTRIVDAATGWADRFVGDFIDIHIYTGPEPAANALDHRGSRAAALGEFGGLGLLVKNNSWTLENTFAYQMFNDSASLTAGYVDHLQRLKKLILPPVGFSIGVYTEITDIEAEINGVMTYDREVYKMDVNAAYEAAQDLYNVYRKYIVGP